MHVHRGLCVNINDIERVHNNDWYLRDLRCRQLVCWRCRATGGLYLHSWLLRSRGSRYDLCGYGGGMHDLHCGQLLRRGCLCACCMQLRCRVLLCCWCRHHMYRHCWKLRCLRRREVLCRRRRCGSRMHVHRGVCVNVDDIEWMHNNNRIVRCVSGRQLV